MGTGAPQLLGRERREAIVTMVESDGAVRVSELTTRFGVSAMTIRRDIEALASVNRLVRVHGGATRLPAAALAVDEPGFVAKSRRNLPQKRAIAERAASRIRPGSAIGITAGTTTYQLVRELATIERLTVVTNSLPIAVSLGADSGRDTQVVVTGGSPTPSNAIVGPVAERSLASVHLDQVFMGVHGMDQTGFLAPSLAEAQTNLAFIQAAREVLILADSTKWEITGLGVIAPLSAADVLVTTTGLEDDAIATIAAEIESIDIVG